MNFPKIIIGLKPYLLMYQNYLHSRFLLIVFLFLSFSSTSQTDLGSYTIGTSDAVDHGNGCVTLTQHDDYKVGTMWFNQKFNLSKSFDVRVDMNFGNVFCWRNCCATASDCASNSYIYPEEGGGADGIAFVLQQQSINAGSPGGGIGYQGIQPSIAVEFDTYFNFGDDPLYDHIGISVNGDVDLVCNEDPNQHWAGSVCNNDRAGTTNARGGYNITDLMVPAVGTDPSRQNQSLQDGQDHEARFVWDVNTKIFEVWLDCKKKIALQEDIVATIFNGNPNAFIGFTASTGNEYNKHSICVDLTQPSLNPLVDRVICPNNSLNFDASINDPTPSTNYTWKVLTGDMGSLGSTSGPQVSVTPNMDTEYQVIIETSCYPDDPKLIDTVKVIVGSNIQIDNDKAECIPGQQQYIVSFEIADADIATLTVTGINGTLTKGTPSTFISDPIPESTTYSATIQDKCGALLILGTQVCPTNCTIYPQVEAGNDIALCAGENYTVNDASAIDVNDNISLTDPSKAGIEWTATGGNGLLTNVTTISPTYQSTTSDVGKTIKLYLLGKSGMPIGSGCEDVLDSLSLTFTAPPTVDAGLGGTICEGDVLLIAGVDAQNYSSLNWIHNGDGTIDATDPLAPIYSSTSLDNGKRILLTLEVNANAPCTQAVSDTVGIQVDVIPTIDASSLQPICEGNTANLVGIGTNTGTVLWTKNSGNGSLTNATQLIGNYQSNTSDAGTTIAFAIEAQSQGICPSVTSSVDLEIVALPTIQLQTSGSTCVDTPYDITAVTTNILNFTWSHSGNGSFADLTSLLQSYIPADTDAGRTIDITFSAIGNAPCNNSLQETIQIIVSPLPMVQAPDDLFLCPGENGVLDPATITNTASYSWNIIQGNSIGVTDLTTLTPNIDNPSAVGGDQILLEIIGSPQTPCTSIARDTVLIEYLIPPTFNLTDAIVCPEENATLTAEFIDQNKATNFLWFKNQGSNTPIHEGFTYTQSNVVLPQTLWVTSKDGCPTPKRELSLNVHSAVSASFTAVPSVITTISETVQFLDASINTVSGTWDFGDRNTSPYQITTNQDHLFSIIPPDIPASYVVSLNVESVDGCINSTQVIIPVDLKWGLFAPNAFSPNGDGINDYFITPSFGIDTYDLWIFNRWGDNIFYSDNPSINWDGSDHNRVNKQNISTDPAKLDTYVYKIKVINIFGEEHIFRGEVHLIK